MGDKAPERTGSERTFATIGSSGVTGEKPQTNYIITLMHLVKGYIGTGIFSMGVAYKFCGIITSSIFLALLGVINLHCQHQLLKCADKIASREVEDVKPNFVETVEFTARDSKFAWLKKKSAVWGNITLTFTCITELGFCCVYFVFIAEHVLMILAVHYPDKFVVGEGEYMILAIILGPMWASTFLGNLKLLFPLSVTANVLMCTAIIFVFYYTLSGGLVSLNERSLFIANAAEVPLYFGIALFAFEGITFILPLRNEMKDTRQFTVWWGVLNVGMTLVGILMFFVGFLAYWKYGDEIKSSFFLDIELDAMGQSIVAIVSIAVLFTFTIHMYIPFEISYPFFHRRFGPFKHEYVAMGIYRSVPVLLCYCIAHIGKLGLFISLVGASTGAMLTLILPPILETVAFWEDLRLASHIKNGCIITIGVAGAILGTAISLKDIIEAYTVE